MVAVEEEEDEQLEETEEDLVGGTQKKNVNLISISDDEDEVEVIEGEVADELDDEHEAELRVVEELKTKVLLCLWS